MRPTFTYSVSVFYTISLLIFFLTTSLLIPLIVIAIFTPRLAKGDMGNLEEMLLDFGPGKDELKKPSKKSRDLVHCAT